MLVRQNVYSLHWSLPCDSHLSYKGIAYPLLPHRRLGSVPAEQTSLIGQGEHLRPDALDQLVPVAAGQIRTPNRTGKDQVTAEADVRGSNIEYTVTRRMPGRETDFELHAAKPQ